MSFRKDSLAFFDNVDRKAAVADVSKAAAEKILDNLYDLAVAGQNKRSYRNDYPCYFRFGRYGIIRAALQKALATIIYKIDLQDPAEQQKIAETLYKATAHGIQIRNEDEREGEMIIKQAFSLPEEFDNSDELIAILAKISLAPNFEF